jgi:hypothetical protein
MSASVASRRWRLAVRLAVAGLVWALGAVLAAVLVHAYDADTTSPAGGLTLTRDTLLESKGAGALVLVAIPLLLAIVVLVAMWYRRRRDAPWSGRVAWAAIALLAAESLVGILTIGAFMVPAAVLLAAGIRLAPSP